MQQVLLEDYGNPSSLHGKGLAAEHHVKAAREEISQILKARDKEIIFTSGGTESNNLAIFGTALARHRAGRHIITSAIEHPSVYNPMAFLEERGFEVDYLPVDGQGRISLDALESKLRDDTILVSLMHVNNEIGTVEPIEEAAKIVHAHCPDALFHTDAVQSFGKLRIYPKKMGVDLLSASGHKFHGPKGVGFLYVGEKAKIRPIIYGGGQQKDMRSGTENVAGIAGIGAAASEAYEGFDEKIGRLYELREYLLAGLRSLDGVVVHGAGGFDAAPHIVSAGFEGVRAEVLLHALEERGVYVSSGSACSSNHPAVSGTLKAIGARPELLDSTLRFSLSVHSTREEADYALAQLSELLPSLRRFTRK